MLKKVTESSSPSKMKQTKRMIDMLDRLIGQPFDKDIPKDEKELYMAESLELFTKDLKGNPLEQVRIKGSGYGYYYSLGDKKAILVPRNAEYYLVSEKKDPKGRLKLYSHYKFSSGAVILVPEDEIERIGWN
jgi:hypothetical protein